MTQDRRPATFPQVTDSCTPEVQSLIGNDQPHHPGKIILSDKYCPQAPQPRNAFLAGPAGRLYAVHVWSRGQDEVLQRQHEGEDIPDGTERYVLQFHPLHRWSPAAGMPYGML
jgi:hypothetical protein